MAEYWKRGVGLPSTVQSPCGEVLSGLQVVSRLDKDNLSSASPDMAGEAEGVPQSPRTSQRESDPRGSVSRLGVLGPCQEAPMGLLAELVAGTGRVGIPS